MVNANQENGATRVPAAIYLVAMLLPIVSSINISSAARQTFPSLYWKQLIWATGALVVSFIIARTRTSLLEAVSYPFYVVVNVLLLLVLAIATPIKGSQRWLDLGIFSLQPSELAKISMILVVAKYFEGFVVKGGYTLRQLIYPLNLSRPLALGAGLIVLGRKEELVNSIHTAFTDATGLDPVFLWIALVSIVAGWAFLALLTLIYEGLSQRRLIAPVDVILVPFLLILVEPDLGTASITLAIAGSMILFSGVRPLSLLLAAAVGISGAVLAWDFVLHDYQKKRIETFLDPESDVKGAGYHAAQSIIAVGSGQLTGKGYGEGTQTQLSFLPENHTDFAFSVLAEEWGFVGAVTVIGLLFILIVLMLRAASKATNRFAALMAVGAASMLFWHAFINIGMVIGVLPIVGVPLPLVSYGGSAMITQMIAIGLAANAQTWSRRS